MKLDPQRQKTLLELANLERSLASGVSGRVSPEQETLDRLEAEQIRLRDAASAAQMAVDDIDNEILRIQSDERKLRRRKKDGQDALGAETDPERRRDLTHDVYTAKSRIADLMSELQEAHNEIHALRNNRDLAQERIRQQEQRIEGAREARDAAVAATAQVEDPRDIITRLAESLPADVIAEYERQRAENGVGVAQFNGRSCTGCAMVLPAGPIALVRNTPADVLPQCPECGSYLVRNHA
ncbi:zinc ribbon domain-containing protein [Corynebacterium pacaense]|uniref:zinc ribbon domain-containing protein n=1 Tax=Corynebacterium pacaense TaxID=1816684 RepID=UPI0009BBA8D0|nr:zinc ribbon domain-containing protein [Corynebacterium pacaense]